eukprot:TRINITY_DN3655_c0_g2_i1.p1 TRINITY_DN3655_c0_g2~~TRINITY_DN3655_c0_g2_i1.p1  ORF type:complete len:101 (+),score=3.79 TRINITY_DN3655_c0_g2_i1:3-305(+)
MIVSKQYTPRHRFKCRWGLGMRMSRFNMSCTLNLINEWTSLFQLLLSQLSQALTVGVTLLTLARLALLGTTAGATLLVTLARLHFWTFLDLFWWALFLRI